MRIASAVMLALLMASEAGALRYHSLAEAFRASAPGRRDLEREAVQYIVDTCRLKWALDHPDPFREHYGLMSRVSSDGRFCILARPYACEGCEGWSGAVALVDTAGLLWTREGESVAPAIVAANGTAALFLRAGGEYSYPPSLRLVIVSATGDTLGVRQWFNRAPRPLSTDTGFGEVCAFSPDSKFLLLTMNTQRDNARGEYNNTELYCLSLDDGLERVRKLGAFWPTDLEISAEGAVLSGDWRSAFTIGKPFDAGFYRVTWSPWSVEKQVTRTVEPAWR